MSALLILINRLSTIPIKIPTSYFVDIDKFILKLYMETQKDQNIHSSIAGEELSWRIDFKIYY